MDHNERMQSHRGATLTVRLPEGTSLRAILSRLSDALANGLHYVELRDDLLDDETIVSISESLPAHARLLSLRRKRAPAEQSILVRRCQPALLDVARELEHEKETITELSQSAEGITGVVSCHTRSRTQSLGAQLATLAQTTPQNMLVKAALPIDNLAELLDGHRWHLQHPERHLFLPIASDGSGRFRFYRLLLADSLRLNFLRDEEAPLIPDQPALADWQTRLHIPIPPHHPIPFAAIVGNPVEHSRTPAYHGAFFARYGMPVFKVCVTDSDLASDVLSLLTELGLRACAVTSPHKQWLRDSIDAHAGQWEVLDPRDPQRAGNTLALRSDGTSVGASTDGIGLRAAWEDCLHTHSPLLGSQPAIAVFGGGGLLPLLQAVFPQAIFLSARSGMARDEQPSDDTLSAVQVVIWSVGKARHLHNPPSLICPKLVFDLNYSADSPGRAYAQAVGAAYVDGSLFFIKQADAQQRFWQRHLGIPTPPTDQVDSLRRSP